MPLFSVVIPTYNRAASCAAAVRSVLAQTDPDFECFVVDDGSTDDTRRVLEKFQSDPRVRLVFNERNRGQHACRNQAIRMSTGRWIAFLDSDDLFLPGRLTALRRYIEREPHVGFLFTNAFIHRFGRIIGLLFDPARELPGGVVPGYYAVGDEFLPYVTTMVAVRRDAFDRTGFFREDMRILEDTELYARMLKDGLEVGAIHFPHAVRFIHEGQITRDHLKDFEESMMALEASDPPPAIALRIRRKVAYEVAGYLWRAGRADDAKALLRREFGAVDPGFLLKGAVPAPILALARAGRELYLRARFHPLVAPAEFREANRLVDRFLTGREA